MNIKKKIKKIIKRRMKLTIVSGASENHEKSLYQFVESLYKNAGIEFDCFIYDLGLSKVGRERLELGFDGKIKMRDFHFERYPSYFEIEKNAGEYAWKPAIIYEVMNEVKDGILLWCDAGNIITENLERLVKRIEEIQIFSSGTAGDVRRWTHPKTLEYFGCKENESLLQFTNRNGAMFGFHLTNSLVQDFIQQFYQCALTKECIAPEGSSRENHRQDQAVFTILYYFFIHKHGLQYEDQYFGIRIHNDID